MAGVYNGGEIYLRGIQRASSLAFGTPPGRFLSQYIALPFGGAFLALEFTQHMVHAGEGLYKFASKVLAPKPAPVPVEAAPAQSDDWVWSDEVDDFVRIDRVQAVQVAKDVFTSSDKGPQLVTWPAFLGLGLFLLLLFYWPAFRAIVYRGVKLLGLGVRYLFRDLPLAAWQSGPVRAIRRHPTTRWLTRRFGSGVIVAVVVAAVLAFFGASPGRIASRGRIPWFAILVTLLRFLPVGRKLG